MWVDLIQLGGGAYAPCDVGWGCSPWELELSEMKFKILFTSLAVDASHQPEAQLGCPLEHLHGASLRPRDLGF